MWKKHWRTLQEEKIFLWPVMRQHTSQTQLAFRVWVFGWVWNLCRPCVGSTKGHCHWCSTCDGWCRKRIRCISQTRSEPSASVSKWFSCIPLFDMKTVVSTRNFIKSRGLNNPQLKELLSEPESQWRHLVYHCEVRWLSQFYTLQEEVRHLMKGKPVMELSDVAFMGDITMYQCTTLKFTSRIAPLH